MNLWLKLFIFFSPQEKGVRPDVSTYNTLISALVSAGDLEAAEVLLGEMGVQKGEKRGISPPKPQVRTLSILVKGYVDQGKVEKALEVLYFCTSLYFLAFCPLFFTCLQFSKPKLSSASYTFSDYKMYFSVLSGDEKHGEAVRMQAQ